MMTDFTIRHVKPEDKEMFRNLRLEALKNHPNAFGQDYDEIKTKDETYWEGRVKIDPTQDAIFFAEAAGKIVGMSGIYRSAMKKSRHSAIIWGVYVTPEWRGRKISEDLIRHCLNWAEERGVIIVKLAVVTVNTPAIRCYERCGFKIYGVEPRAIFYDNVYYDEYLMSLNVNI